MNTHNLRKTKHKNHYESQIVDQLVQQCKRGLQPAVRNAIGGLAILFISHNSIFSVSVSMTTTDAIHEILNRINAIYAELRFIRNIVEKRLMGEEEPLEDEIKAIKEYEERKKKKEIEFVPPEEILGE